MKQTLKLTKIYFKETLFSIVGNMGKKAGKRTMPFLVLLALIIAAAMGFSLYNMAEILQAVALVQNVLIIGLLMAMFVSLMITLNDSQGTMYRSKDYDLLSSLPLKTSTIIFAKYASTYLVTMLWYAIVAIPTFVVYSIFVGVSAWTIVFGLLSILFMPAFSQLIGCLVGWLVNFISSKFGNFKFMRTIMTIILAIGVFVFMYFANSDIFENAFSEGIPLWFKIVFSNIYFLYEAIVGSNVLYFLASLAVGIALIALGMLVVSIGYKKINSALLSTRVRRKQKPLTYKSRSSFLGLFRKEIVCFFSSPIYCMNGLIGNIMVVLVTISTTILCVTFQDLGELSEFWRLFAFLQVFGVTLCTGIAPTTSVSISMEGTKLQNLKTLPIKFKTIVLAKVSLNFMLSFPVVLVSHIVFSAVVGVGFVPALLIVLYGLVGVVMQTLLGLVLNIRFPRLNWTSETQAAKSGASMLLTMLLDMLLSFIPIVVSMEVMGDLGLMSIELFVGIFLAVEVVLTIVVLAILIAKGERMFRKIKC